MRTAFIYTYSTIRCCLLVIIIYNCHCVKVHKLFALLNLSHAYVTSLGRLVGVVALTEVSLVTKLFQLVLVHILH